MIDRLSLISEPVSCNDHKSKRKRPQYEQR